MQRRFVSFPSAGVAEDKTAKMAATCKSRESSKVSKVSFRFLGFLLGVFFGGPLAA